jgi:hypothetical protein
MPVRLHHIVVDAHDLPGLARFWTQALGWKVPSERDNEIVIGLMRTRPSTSALCRSPISRRSRTACVSTSPAAPRIAIRRLTAFLRSERRVDIAAHRSCLPGPPPAATPDPGPPAEPPPLPQPEPEPAGKFADRARRHHAMVHELLAEGHGMRTIARHLGWGRHTVQRYARAATWQELADGRWQADGHVRAFAIMLTQLTGQDLPQWISDVRGRRIARTVLLRQGPRAGPRRRYPGPDEPLELRTRRRPRQTTSLEMIKRQMFGRAGLPLLRKRVLLIQAAPRGLPPGRQPGLAGGLPGLPPPPHRPLADPQLRGDHRSRHPLLESHHRFQPDLLPASSALGGQPATLRIPHVPYIPPEAARVSPADISN